MSDEKVEVAFNEIMSAIYQLRIAFLKHGMSPPVSIELAKDRDTDWFRYNLPPHLALAQPRMGETRTDAEWVCNIMGMEVRMPAQWRKELDGRSRLV